MSIIYLLVFPYTVNTVDTRCHKCHDVHILVLWDSSPGVTNVTMYIYRPRTLSANKIGIYLPNDEFFVYVLRESTISAYDFLITSVASVTTTQD